MKRTVITILFAALAAFQLAAQSGEIENKESKDKLAKLEQAKVEARKARTITKKGVFELTAVDHFTLGFHSLDIAGEGVSTQKAPFGSPSREIGFGIINVTVNPVSWGDIRLGVDLKWDQWGIKKPHQHFIVNEKDDVLYTVNPEFAADASGSFRSFIKTTSFTAPVSIGVKIGKLGIRAGGEFQYILPRYSRVIESFEHGDLYGKWITHGINLRKYTYDFSAVISYSGLGIYFKYYPEGILPEGSTFKMDPFCTFGFVIGL